MGAENVFWRKKIGGLEVDVFIPKYNLGIEFNGAYWHKGKYKFDQEKNELFRQINVDIIRVRETPLEPTSPNDITVPNHILNMKVMDQLVLKIKSVLKQSNEIRFDDYLNKSSFLNDKEFRRFISFFLHPRLNTQFLTLIQILQQNGILRKTVL